MVFSEFYVYITRTRKKSRTTYLPAGLYGVTNGCLETLFNAYICSYKIKKKYLSIHLTYFYFIFCFFIIDISTLTPESQSRLNFLITNKVNFISGTMSPSDADKKSHHLESLAKGLEYLYMCENEYNWV